MTKAAADASTDVLPAELRDALLRKIHANELDLPVLPEVSGQVITACSDSDCDLRRLTVLLGRDQSMTTHLLRLANSALYAADVQIVSLQQALSRLGLRKIREIALLISCESRVFRVDGFDALVRALFQHSLIAATFAREIARLRRWNVEEAFLCGLLHDVGRPVLLQALVDLKRESKLVVPREVLIRAADEFHGHVGAELIRSWELPEKVVQAVRFHHDPLGSESASQAAMMTRLADDLAHMVAGPREVTEEAIRAHEMLEPLNLYEDELEGLLRRKDEILAIAQAVA